WISVKLELSSDMKMNYYKYRDRAHLKSVTGIETNGFAQPGTRTFHSIWAYDPHEATHVIVENEMGFPPAIFSEGIAVAHTAAYPDFVALWNGSDFNLLAKQFRKGGQIPSLNQLLVSRSFRNYSDLTTYPVFGSFVSFLISRYGPVKLKDFFRVCKYSDGLEKINSDFLKSFGISVETAWNEWGDFVDRY
ncbi:MAG: hypothetical protein ACKOE6_00040, partial [Flammeovirgaceae bacterium]